MNQPPRIAVLVVAAGVGARAGGALPKQYQRVAGKPLLRHGLERLLAHPSIVGVRVVIHPDHADFYAAAVDGLTLPPPVFGGVERQDSVRAGLEALAADAPEYVLIHDAARPFIAYAVIDRLVEALQPTTGAVPALPVADTVRRASGGTWEEVLRDGLLRIQTPQAFPFETLRVLHASASTAATDDAALWLAAGHRLVYIEGDEDLRKVTTAADIHWAETRSAQGRVAVGSGFDVHRFVPGDGVTIGGIRIPHSKTLDGHSDADVALHALVDALLGALGEGDIGTHFPPSDARWKGADSAVFVAEALRLCHVRGAQIQHVDLTIIGEEPKIGPHRDAMRERIAHLLGLPIGFISVKATTTERLGFTGRGEGIAAQATATLTIPWETA